MQAYLELCIHLKTNLHNKRRLECEIVLKYLNQTKIKRAHSCELLRLGIRHSDVIVTHCTVSQN